MNMRCFLILSIAFLLGTQDSRANNRLPSFMRRGQCSPRIKPVRNFSREQFTGRWYKIGGFKNPEEEKAVNCTTLDYSVRGSGMSVTNHGLDSLGLEVNPRSKPVAYRMENVNIGGFEMTLDGSGRDVPLVILDTDYRSYACLISCLNIAETHHATFAWILNRNPDFSRQVISTCQLAFQNAKIPVGKLRGTWHGSQCDYFPLANSAL